MNPHDFALCGHITVLSLRPFLDTVKNYARSDVSLYHPQGFVEVLNRIEKQVERLRYCVEVNFAHQSWAKFDFETTDPFLLENRIFEAQQKLNRIAARYQPREKE